MSYIEKLIRKIPKADIHVHFEGLITRPLFEKLLRSKNTPNSNLSSQIFRDAYRNLDDFVDACRSAVTVIRTAEDCYQVVTEYLKASRADNVVHVEIAVEPEVHASRGLFFEPLATGIRRALEWGQHELGISSNLILSLVRDLPADVAMRNFDVMHRDPSLFVAIGLASREKDNPPTKFRKVFERARSEGFRLVAHAGEEGPPSYIRSAIVEMGVDRIDHGLTAADDSQLLELIESRQIPLALAPVAYSKIGQSGGVQVQRLRKLIHSKLLVSLNSDDPGLFQAGVVSNFIYCANKFSLNVGDVFRLAANSIESSFLPREQKDTWLKQIDAMRVNGA